MFRLTLFEEGWQSDRGLRNSYRNMGHKRLTWKKLAQASVGFVQHLKMRSQGFFARLCHSVLQQRETQAPLGLMTLLQTFQKRALCSQPFRSQQHL